MESFNILGDDILKYIYFGIYIIIICFATLFFKKASSTFSLKKLNIISITYYYFMIFFIIGFGLNIIGVRSSKMLRSGTPISDNKIIQISVVVGLLFLLLSIIIYILNIIFPVNKINNITKKKYFFNKSSFLGATILLLFVILGLIYVGIKNNGFPIFTLLKGGSSLEVGRARAGFKNGIPYVKNLLVRVGAPISAGMFFVLLKVYKKNILKYIMFFVSWSILLFVSIMTTAKAPLILFFGFFYILKIYIGENIKIKNIIIMGVIILSLLVIINILVESNINNFYDNIYNLFDRIFLAQTNGTYYIFDIINTNEFLGINGISNTISNLFGTQYINPHRYAMRLYSSGAIERGTGGQMSTLFIAEAYAVGGFIMAVFSVFIVGIFIYLLYYLFEMKLPNSPFFVSLKSYFSVFWVFSINSGFFTNFIFNWTFIFVLIIFIVGYFPYLSIKNKKG